MAVFDCDFTLFCLVLGVRSFKNGGFNSLNTGKFSNAMSSNIALFAISSFSSSLTLSSKSCNFTIYFPCPLSFLGSCPSVHFGHQSPVSTSQQSGGWGRAPGGSALCVVSWGSANITANSCEADIANSYGERTSLGVQW